MCLVSEQCEPRAQRSQLPAAVARARRWAGGWAGAGEAAGRCGASAGLLALACCAQGAASVLVVPSIACSSFRRRLDSHATCLPALLAAVNKAGRRWGLMRKWVVILFGAELAIQAFNLVRGQVADRCQLAG